MTDELAALAEAEVRGLHEFFENWFRGAIPSDDISRLAGVLAVGFTLRSPGGESVDRDTVLADVGANHGALAMSITIEDVRLTASDPITVEYEEWQELDGSRRGRSSVAVFSPADGTPNGLAWFRVHETKLAGWG